MSQKGEVCCNNALPLRSTGAPPPAPGGRAPLFSEHTHELVTELAGVGEEEYEELRAAEVVDAHPTGLDLR